MFPSILITYASHILFGLSLAAVLCVCRSSIRKSWGAIKSQVTPEEADKGSAVELILLGIAAGIGVVCLFSMMSGNPWMGFGFGLLTAIVLPIWLSKKRRRDYLQAFDRTLAESLMTVASSLRAGLTLRDALTVAADNCPAPFSTEVGRALKEYHFGTSIEEALESLRHRVGTTDTKISFGAMIIGSQLGGKLPLILKKIVKTIRERERVEGRLKALTAQGRSQAALLCAAPPVLGVGMYFYDTQKMSLLTDTIPGQVMLAIAIALELIGIVVTLKVMKLDV
jgi:tight adherence protein B